MDSQPTDLYRLAVRLDEEPEELLNGGASEGLRVLSAISPEAVASERGIEVGEVKALWDRAGARLSAMPEPAELYPAAAEAATLLYGAAWVAGSASATVEDVRALI
jgi:hypothetical protein